MCGSEINQETDTQLIVHSPWPEGAKYENTIDEISFDFLNNYPFKQPTIKLITPKEPSLFQKIVKYMYFLY